MENPQTFHWLLIYLGIAAGVWAYRIFRLLMTLTKTPVLRPAVPPAVLPNVSVLIPAKNEEKNIKACWESLRAQTYSPLEILVINDNSTDQTENILKSLGASYLNSPKAPEGWTGKNHALDYGSKNVTGDWLLFTDADTRHQNSSVASAITYCQTHNLDFLSLLPRCLTGSFLEDALQPAAMAYLGLWFPFEKVNDPRSPLYFGNGQFLLIKRELYLKLGGHRAVAGEFLEDFALMRLSKNSGARAVCGLGGEIYGTRMYDSWDGIWRGWRRIYLHAFQQNPWPLVKNALSIFLFSSLPFALHFFLKDLPGDIAVFSFLLMLSILMVAFPAYRTVKAKGIFAVFHPFAALVISLILLDAAGMAFLKKKTVWR